MANLVPQPEGLHSYNVYDVTEKIIGVANNVKLPNFEAMTETITGAGILGSRDVPMTGHFTDLTIEFNFRTLESAVMTLMRETSDILYLRGGQQYYEHSSGKAVYHGIKITLRRRPKALDLGKLEQAKAMESKVTLSVYYIKIESDGKILIEYDPYNFVYIVNDVDLLADLRTMI
ncbi:MAG: phage major tail tube protein [Clostridiales bacterium]|jgi:P2 family phage contractile tail tube protein|nr:phage major tail tube protein [Clostridiales bacterium]